jgi:hypothetical protein
MNTNKNTTRLADVRINVKIKLSALWVTLMLFYIYAEILGFYTPGIIENLIEGEIGGIQITEIILFVMAVWMAIPSVMVFLSLTLKSSVNRWINLIVGFLSLLVLGATFFAGEISARYAFQAIVEAMIIVFILGQAWKWPEEQVKG